MTRRWRYADTAREEDRNYVDKTHRQIQSWWQAFGDKRSDLEALFAGQAEWNLVAWMQDSIQPIHPDLMWEFGPARRCDGHQLVITPEDNFHLMPLTQSILQAAPDLPAWEFYCGRPPVSLVDSIALVDSKTGGDLRDVEVSITLNADHKIDLSYYSSQFTRGSDPGAHETAFFATETLLGEAILSQWIGTIEMRAKSADTMTDPTDHFSLPEPSATSGDLPRVPIRDLYSTVDELIKDLKDSLPAVPCMDRIHAASWSAWRPKRMPEARDDYPDQVDLVTQVTCFPDILEATRALTPFFSSSHSRCSETFCYLKIDGSDGLEDDGFEDRATIEDALTHTLVTSRHGCVIGGGTGLRYSYIDLALLDVDRALPDLCKLLRQGGLPDRSWLLFHDTHLEAEWIGIYPHTPPPPERS